MTSCSGSSTQVARGALSSRSSRSAPSNTLMSIHESTLVTPMRSQNSWIASGVKPRRRTPTMVGMRGSSQPSTWPSVTSCSSLRLLVIAYVRFRRENSICCGSRPGNTPAGGGEFVENPVVQRPVVFEFERAQRMRDVLERIRNAVRVVVHRIHAPGVAGAVVMREADAVQHRVAHIEVRRRHVDLRAQHVLAFLELAGLHAAEQVEVLFDGALAIRRRR